MMTQALALAKKPHIIVGMFELQYMGNDDFHTVLTTTSYKVTFLQDFRETLKDLLQNFQKILKKCYLCNACVMIFALFHCVTCHNTIKNDIFNLYSIYQRVCTE